VLALTVKPAKPAPEMNVVATVTTSQTDSAIHQDRGCEKRRLPSDSVQAGRHDWKPAHRATSFMLCCPCEPSDFRSSPRISGQSIACERSNRYERHSNASWTVHTGRLSRSDSGRDDFTSTPSHTRNRRYDALQLLSESWPNCSSIYRRNPSQADLSTKGVISLRVMQDTAQANGSPLGHGLEEFGGLEKPQALTVSVFPTADCSLYTVIDSHLAFPETGELSSTKFLRHTTLRN
jgi:hypothetical protein